MAREPDPTRQQNSGEALQITEPCSVAFPPLTRQQPPQDAGPVHDLAFEHRFPVLRSGCCRRSGEPVKGYGHASAQGQGRFNAPWKEESSQGEVILPWVSSKSLPLIVSCSGCCRRSGEPIQGHGQDSTHSQAREVRVKSYFLGWTF